jgi:hypothetical protein
MVENTKTPRHKDTVKLNSIVIVNLQAPRERFFGRLLDMATYGITVRGIDLNAFEDWMDHITHREESGVQPTTVFFRCIGSKKSFWMRASVLFRHSRTHS